MKTLALSLHHLYTQTAFRSSFLHIIDRSVFYLLNAGCLLQLAPVIIKAQCGYPGREINLNIHFKVNQAYFVHRACMLKRNIHSGNVTIETLDAN